MRLASAPRERIESIDAIRGIALFGVLMVNLLTEFRVSIFHGPRKAGMRIQFIQHFLTRVVLG